MLKLSQELDDKGNIAIALNSLGALALAQGNNERARALLEENLSVLRELEDESNAATTLQRYQVLGLLGLLALNEEGDYTRGAALWEKCLALAREVGDPNLVGQAVSNLGYVALLQGDHERAAALSEEALTLAYELGSAGVEFAPEAMVNLGLATLNQGDHKRAAASFKEALAVSKKAGKKPTVINALMGMASLAGSLGEANRAARLWGAAQAAREATGIALPPGERALHEPYLASARSRLGEAAWEEALGDGRAMSLEEAAEYALAKAEIDRSTTPVPEQMPAGEPADELSRREKEVATLVAQGLTNRQISTELSISERTAGNHVAKILSKLGLRSRAQIASWATEYKLPTPPHPE
jgi:non-specific serine/threonine protein kinase